MSNISYIADILDTLSHMTTDKTVIDVLLRAKQNVDEHIQSGAIAISGEEECLVRDGEKIEAIKRYRARTGARLRTAKQVVDDCFDNTLTERERYISNLLSAAKSQYSHLGVEFPSASDYKRLRAQLNELGGLGVPSIRAHVNVLDNLE